jgi:hypothetical protein
MQYAAPEASKIDLFMRQMCKRRHPSADLEDAKLGYFSIAAEILGVYCFSADLTIGRLQSA